MAKRKKKKHLARYLRGGSIEACGLHLLCTAEGNRHVAKLCRTELTLRDPVAAFGVTFVMSYYAHHLFWATFICYFLPCIFVNMQVYASFNNGVRKAFSR